MKKINLPENRLLTDRMGHFLGIDLRSLALLRVGLALLVIVDLIQRSFDLRAHYSDMGILPRWALTQDVASKWHFSFHNINGSSEFEATLFLVHGVIALFLLIGFKTRLSTVICWVLTISLQSRNPLILSGGDHLLVLLLFWSAFLPIGSRFSVDRALARDQIPEHSSLFCSPATFAIMLQLCFMYWFNWIAKSHPIWTEDHTALYYALNLDLFATKIGSWLRTLHPLTSFLTVITYWLELLGPILVFSPICTKYIRILVLLAFVSFHIGIALTLHIGYFPAVAIVAWSIFIPGMVWNKITAYLDTRPTSFFHIYFDGECDFCKKTVLLLQTFLIWRNAKISPAQSNQRIESIFRANNSWVIIDDQGIERIGFRALTYALRQTPFIGIGAVILKIPPIPSLGQSAYSYIAHHRNLFSHFTNKLNYRCQHLGIPNWAHALSLLMLIYVSVWNITGIRGAEFDMPRQFYWVGPFFRVYQHWHMFAPYPLRNDGWYVIPGQLSNQTEVNIYDDSSAVNWLKPSDVSSTYANNRWRKYLTSIYKKKNKDQRLYYGRYLCREWNRSHLKEEQLETFQIYFMEEFTRPPGEPITIKKQLIWRHDCFMNPQRK